MAQVGEVSVKVKLDVSDLVRQLREAADVIEAKAAETETEVGVTTSVESGA